MRKKLSRRGSQLLMFQKIRRDKKKWMLGRKGMIGGEAKVGSLEEKFRLGRMMTILYRFSFVFFIIFSSLPSSFPIQYIIPVRTILINLIYMLQSRLSHQSFQSNSNLPQKQEWSIIYKHRALQLQKAKSMEKMISQQKKDRFKSQLDQQIVSKNNVGQAQKEEDRRYYEYIQMKAQEMKEKEEREKFERFIKHKQIQEHNLKAYERTSSPKKREEELSKSYNLQIGLKSEIQKKERAESIRKDVIETLDHQRQHKQEERRKKREQEIQQFYKNQAYQEEQHSNRAKQSRKYEQNQGVYNFYKDLFNQKMRKDKELQHKFVDLVQQRKEEQQLKKKENDLIEKERKNLEMKDTLQRQLQLLLHRRSQQKNGNPEQATYSFINNMFKEKKPAFDKREYSQFLDRQAQEQRLNKLQQHYMSQEQYKFNSNQLNRALSGNYTFDKYHDRSINTLGDKVNISQVQPFQGSDAELVKTKLETLRSRNRSMMQSRSEMDHSFS